MLPIGGAVRSISGHVGAFFFGREDQWSVSEGGGGDLLEALEHQVNVPNVLIGRRGHDVDVVALSNGFRSPPLYFVHRFARLCDSLVRALLGFTLHGRSSPGVRPVRGTPRARPGCQGNGLKYGCMHGSLEDCSVPQTFRQPQCQAKQTTPSASHSKALPNTQSRGPHFFSDPKHGTTKSSSVVCARVYPSWGSISGPVWSGVCTGATSRSVPHRNVA